jgi:integrase
VTFDPFARLKPLVDAEVSFESVRAPSLGDGDELDASALVTEDDDSLSNWDSDDEPDPLSQGEMLAVLAQFDQAMRNHYTFAFHTGVRTGEQIALRVNDIDWKGNRVLVRRSLSRGILKKPKMNKGRWVDLLPPAREALNAQIDLLDAPNGWVFPNPFTRGRWANESKLTKRWRTALSKAGVRYRRPYHTRHSYASMMLSSGENLLYVAKQLGHADWRMVQERYARWMPSGFGRAAGSAVAEANTAAWARVQSLLVGVEPGVSSTE